jgi:hypothetical protein
MENIEKILQAEQASAQVVQGKSMDSNTDRPKNPLPPELPTETVLYGDSKGGSGDFGLEEQVIMEMEKDDNRQKNILNFLIGGSILLTTYLVVKKKR